MNENTKPTTWDELMAVRDAALPGLVSIGGKDMDFVLYPDGRFIVQRWFHATNESRKTMLMWPTVVEVLGEVKKLAALDVEPAH